MKRLIVKFLFISASLLMITPSLEAAQKLKMSTIAPGSSAYLVMTTMATIVNQAQDNFEIKVDATGAATKHMIELAEGKMDLCMTSPVVYSLMKAQKGMYQKLDNAPELAENLNLLFWFSLGQYHVVTYAQSGIRSAEDIRGKRVFLGPPGGGAWAASKEWFIAAWGIEPQKDFNNVKASWSSAFQGFQDRQFDVYVVPGIAPFPQVEQLAMTSKLHLLGLTKEEYDSNPKAIESTTKQGREIGIIPKGVYGKNVDNDSDIYTLGSIVGVSVNTKMDPETAYQLTKYFWEGAKKNVKSHPWLENLSMEYGVRDNGMKLHPGAARYYKEMGVTIPKGSL